MMTLVGRLLRAPGAVARQCLEGEGQRELVTTSLVAIAFGAGIFGAVVGSFRGDLQVLYASLKLPLALLATLVVCVPGFHVLALALDQPRTLRATISLALAAAGRGALVLLALSPLLWLAIDAGASYHGSVLLASACYGVAGLAALSVLLRGLGTGGRRLMSAAASIVLFLAVSGQTGWILRPYLGRPAQQEIPFLRAREGGFADAVWTSGRSARGDYDEPPAPIESTPPLSGAVDDLNWADRIERDDHLKRMSQRRAQ
ncbi:MAG: hypothetical protein DRJ42_02800 [Deltaproteobacteria bacterium]|nr:MAG: hypothetical protein DRJ42_02800 [Deltaproteobacteria bacterium]